MVLDITFIIPAYNEEKCISSVIASIKKFTPSKQSYEILVVDNGSTDDTADIAREQGAKVYVNEYATIGGLRNYAARHAAGNIYVFLDADMELTERWKQNITKAITAIQEEPLLVTGSRCGVPDNASWIESYWFKPLQNKRSSYINSGHLIVSRKLFDEINGFNEQLKTGEDYAFSMEARKKGGKIYEDVGLAVIHSGYPKTLKEFLRREVWHGIGDCGSLSSFASSKVALVALLIAIMTAGVVLSVFLGAFLYTGAVLLFIILLVCVLSAIYKHKVRAPGALLRVSCLYYLYYISRFLSCLYVHMPGWRKRK